MTITSTYTPVQNNRLAARLLIVDNESKIRAGLSRMLNLEGYIAEETGSGYEALEMLKRYSYNLMLLNLHLPDLDDMAVQQLRQLYPDLLIIVLTEPATLERAIAIVKSDEVVDYLLKPACNKQVVAAVRQALKKQAERLSQQLLTEATNQIVHLTHPSSSILPGLLPPTNGFHAQAGLDRYLQISPFVLDREKQLVVIKSVPNRVIELTRDETVILASLMTIPNQPLSCGELVYLAWGDSLEEPQALNVIQPYILRLRHKIETNPQKPRFICFIHPRGYYFTPAKSFESPECCV